jgi:hypothetical protein
MSRSTSPRPLAALAETAWTTNDGARDLHRTTTFPTAAQAAASKQRRANAKGIVLKGQNEVAIRRPQKVTVYGRKGDNPL